MRLKILYMGTPEFAVEPLQALISAGHQILGVLTQPDKPKGRGMQMSCSAVKVYAMAQEIPVFQPETLREHAIEHLLKQLDPDVIVVAAYGKLLPGYVRRYPQYGCINIHGSLLPKYRGAAPIQRAVINGDAVTGITIMQMERELDAGDILLQREIPILQTDTSETMYQKLSTLGAQMIVEWIGQLGTGAITPRKQDPALVSYAPMLTKEEGRICWEQSAQSIYDLARGMCPWPGVYAMIGETAYKLFGFEKTMLSDHAVPGTIKEIGTQGMLVVCGDGCVLRVHEIQAPGKRRMSVPEFFRGHVQFDRFS